VLDCIAPGQSDKRSRKSTIKAMRWQWILCWNFTTRRHLRTQKKLFYQYLFPIIPKVNCKPWFLVSPCGESIVHDHIYSSTIGTAEPEEKEPVVRYRLPQEKLDHFLDFTSSPRFLQDVAYGTRHLKLSTGEKLEIPGVIRILVNTRMVKLYQAYCNEIGFSPLGKTSLHSILKVHNYV
jgi:hypothetical protein